jgi:cell division cycle protein 37
MTPAITEFSKLSLRGFQESWDFIKTHRDVVVPGASEALLIAGYRAEREGKHKYAKQCVHQSLLLQYGEKLGRDGISVFFNKCVFLFGPSLSKWADLSPKDDKRRCTSRRSFHEGC